MTKQKKTTQKHLTDVHIHAVSFGTSVLHHRSYNRVKAGLKLKVMIKTLSRYHGIKSKLSTIDHAVVERLSQLIDESDTVARGVVFGLDGAYDNKGWLDKERTRFLITNDYVYHALQPFDNLFFAASLNPARRDALDELDRVKSMNAVLVKVLPNTMQFDPSEKRFIPFYKKLAELNLPMLGHTGMEFALAGSTHRLGNLTNYELPLEHGVKFIAAHACSSGNIFYESQVDTMLKFYRRYENFYIDVSALSLWTRFNIIPYLQKHPELNARMFFGTDFPLPVQTLAYSLKFNNVETKKLEKVKNYFDRYAGFLQKFNIMPKRDPFDLFESSPQKTLRPEV